jgi:hypothetical protein
MKCGQLYRVVGSVLAWNGEYEEGKAGWLIKGDILLSLSVFDDNFYNFISKFGIVNVDKYYIEEM